MNLKLKTLHVFAGDNVAKFTNTKPADGTATPIDFDTDTKIATVHFSDTDKMVIDLSKVVMYRYELEQQTVQ